MRTNKVFIATFCIIAFISIGMGLPFDKERNLKVLPKDISEAKLDSIMESYTVALGVKCNFCHVPVKNTDSLDFVSDAEPMKENARRMMRMTIELNKNYFYFDTAVRPEYLSLVTCKTCHRGEAFPPEK
jgi:Photosynthetic reaction centre cytochrome C subunit